MNKIEFSEKWCTSTVSYLELRVVNEDTGELLVSHDFRHQEQEILDKGEGVIEKDAKALKTALKFNCEDDISEFFLKCKNIKIDFDTENIDAYTAVKLQVSLFNFKEQLAELQELQSQLLKYVDDSSYKLIIDSLAKKQSELKDKISLLESLSIEKLNKR